jgi:hypothetical protein
MSASNVNPHEYESFIEENEFDFYLKRNEREEHEEEILSEYSEVIEHYVMFHYVVIVIEIASKFIMKGKIFIQMKTKVINYLNKKCKRNFLCAKIVNTQKFAYKKKFNKILT